MSLIISTAFWMKIREIVIFASSCYYITFPHYYISFKVPLIAFPMMHNLKWRLEWRWASTKQNTEPTGEILRLNYKAFGIIGIH